MCACGGNATVRVVAITGVGMLCVACPVCGMRTGPYDTEAEAISAWNRMQAADAMLEALRDLLHDAKCARGYDPGDSSLDDAMSEGYAAIAAAEGEPEERAR